MLPLPKERVSEIVKGFAPEQLKAPFVLRTGAFLIDYILILLIPVVSLLLAKMMSGDTASSLTDALGSTGWLIMLLFILTNFVIFPILNGQTVGKMLTGLRIVRMDGKPAAPAMMILRHFVGYPLTLLTLGLGYFIAALNRNGRALHDYIAGTTVVHARRRIQS
jgi:uncharacterized RDD family membrane protein YckC